jgi:hypothetical protein
VESRCLRKAGEGRRGTIVGFALTTSQRRLASSPEAIYRSLQRRRKLGIVSPEARAIAERAGMDYVEDACAAIVHRATVAA